ncbi:tetratricopeptide repeat protein [Ruminococcus sp. OA3]|uniref:tetratricopeptide repeat protein n=1 Tax=Ruminococcus sp. OA3 TaxID=2914164 RepID=UPI001F06C06C|nr:tetratricopeptide repeat protein [Ruminococcus sp. OA3]MCH1982823.1 tetratricopeptide repeat protein [Ruminococcus sp. OA3]
MAGYRLCQQKRAKHPYYIENISTGIFSMEELCFYMSNNLYLLDETILNKELGEWIVKELGLAALGQRFLKMLEEQSPVSELVMPIFREIHYLSQAESKELLVQVKSMEEQPLLALAKKKGDALVAYGKYGNAIKVYEKVLAGKPDKALGEQFTGSVWHNLGCAYARMFQLGEASECFEKAYSMMHTKTVLKSYLSCIYLGESREAFLQKGAALGVDSTTLKELETEITVEKPKEGRKQEAFMRAMENREAQDMETYLRTMDEILEEMTEEYHKNTGF